MTITDFDRGLAMRRRVLGDAHVDRALSEAGDFRAPLQDLVTTFAWGTVWTRDDLPVATRSLVTLGILIALNRPHELKAHALGALRNGCTVTDIRAVLLHSAVYCGFPAAVDAFAAVAELIDAVAGDVSPSDR
ncbi:carboxymuconolactone decarboxylase family protein [Xanthobacter autotrophicus]|uniref:carboxymuconolactone decarboxylase family protein n=1 Tax=Xanthobacter autotrophicus TaxID=280 RepID=UPI00372A5A74